jgi:membrane protease YdiL (CAAX protease family)
VTGATVVLGAMVLGVSLRIEPGSDWFYVATLSLALVWTAGALASGPLHLGRSRVPGSRPLLAPLVYGVLLAALFVVGGLVVRQVPALDDQVRNVLDHADQGSTLVLVLVTAVNAVAEELFFRGALYAAVPRYPVVVTTAAYTLATLAAGNLVLAFAAVVLGTLVGLERRATGGILAPALTHVVWSLSMLFALPAIFG